MKQSLLCLLFSVSTITLSQTNAGKISGTVFDENKTAIEFANVMLYHLPDSSLAKGAITDEKGSFELDNITEGTFFIRVSCLLFQQYSSQPLTISKNNPALAIPAIILPPQSNDLSEVTVTTNKQFIEKKLDKLVVNVENSIVSAGNNALEVLARSPGVMVNQDGGINLKGKAGVIILIDDKPTPLSGADLATYLKSIPAANVQLIEIISNPSAKYDAAGNAGIINIKMKKDKREGFNGVSTISYGQGMYPKPSASINLNLRQKKWNLFGNYSFSQPYNFTYFFINRKFFDQNRDLNSVFEQESFTKQPLTAHNVRTGIDFYISPKTVIGVLASGNWNDGQRNGNTDATISYPDGTLNYLTQTTILSKEHRFNGLINCNIKHTIDSTGKELSGDLDFGSFHANNLQDIKNTNLWPNGSVITTNKLATEQGGTITVKSAKVDYVHPFSATAKLEAGLKSSIVTSDNDVRFYNVINDQQQLDTTRSNYFLYEENINAMYVSFSKELSRWDYQCGLRAEYTHTKAKQVLSKEDFKRKYINFFPNIVINRKFSKNNSLSISYARRIDRPSYRQLNPFKIFVDSYTYVVGDPTLNPVLSNIVELNHSFKGKYITTLSYTNSRHSITDVFVQDDSTKISYQIPANIQDFEQFNLGVYIPFTIKKIINSTLSGSVYRNIYSSPLQGAQLHQTFNSWDINLNNVISIGKKGWSGELSAYYQSKMVWGLFYVKQLAQVTAGIQKISKSQNSTLKISVSDIFRTNQIGVIVQYQNQDFYTNRTWDSQVVNFSYTYRFGKNTVTRARQRVSGVEDEKKRIG